MSPDFATRDHQWRFLKDERHAIINHELRAEGVGDRLRLVLAAMNAGSDEHGGSMSASCATIGQGAGVSREWANKQIGLAVDLGLLVPTDNPRRRFYNGKWYKPTWEYAFGPRLAPNHPINQPEHADEKTQLLATYARRREASAERARRRNERLNIDPAA
jgi:hypothetical protein